MLSILLIVLFFQICATFVLIYNIRGILSPNIEITTASMISGINIPSETFILTNTHYLVCNIVD
jgi:hypothetical protein